MPNFRYIHFVFVAIIAVTALYYMSHNEETDVSPSYEADIESFRKAREERLRAPDGWLSVVGLHWLKEGTNTIGRSDKVSVNLPEPAPTDLGEITLNGREAKIRLHDTTGVLIDGVAAVGKKIYDLATDKSEKPTTLSVGDVHFFLLDRPNGVGVRVKDESSETRKNFKGNQWYPPKKNFVVRAEWIDAQTEIEIPDILGNKTKEPSPGYARFMIDGQEQRLYPVKEGDELFFVFRDGTSGVETYGAARFLSASAPKNGKVTLDFNKAINPPCAFTAYATCPLPPKENMLKVAIRAGEMRPEGH